ncbi:MAG: HK97 gp10 family phage protein [Bacillota bacterium]|nr:HK97 gp10 family phage protein [Bacillota bacterium]
MARNDIRIDRLADQIVNAVREYTSEVSEAISEAVDEEANNCLKEIKANSSQWSRYSKGWKIVNKTKFDSSNIYGITRRIIWNPANYRIVHLLEKGHAKRGGGRVQAYPHVLPAEQKYASLLQLRIRRIISGGG